MRRIIILLSLLAAAWTSGFGQAPPSVQHPRFPRIVARISLTGQTDAIPPTTLTTFKTSLYRISTYWEMVVAGPSDCGTSVAPTFGWTDDTQQQQQIVLGPFECTDLNYAQTTVVVHGVAGTPLTYSFQANPHNPGMEYNWYITVEQLE